MNKEKERIVRFLPFDVEVVVEAGATVLDAVRKARLPLKTSCGGQGTCGECLVRIREGEIPQKAVSGLPSHIVSQNFTLACRTPVLDNLTLQLPQFEELSIQSVTESEFFAQNKEKIYGVYEVAPAIKKIVLTIDPPSLENNTSDLKRIGICLKKETGWNDWTCDYPVLEKIAAAVRKVPNQITCVLSTAGREKSIIDVLPGSKKKKILGVACDIGTSTVALHLVDLDSGQILETVSSYNQQIKCGEDIISRINYANKPGHLHELQELILNTVNFLIEKAVDRTGVEVMDIVCAVFSGNTTMTHLFLGCDPRYIREEPYVPTFNFVPMVRAGDLGLTMFPRARIFFTPAVGSYVGGDITAGLLATPILRDSEHVSLFIDAGTNGELVVGNKEWLMTCACSAGPAFEGGGIKCGMPASDGAIEAVKLNDNGCFQYRTINGTKPRGLCGSGLIDLLAELFTHGLIDRNGDFIEKNAAAKLRDTEDGRALLVAGKKETFWGNDLVITEKDIAALIRTKGAVFSACSLLLKRVGLGLDSIETVYIAGGFGRNLDVENAVRIGLLPDLKKNKFQYLGNSSLLGALLILLSESNRDRVERLAEGMTYIELNTEPQYMNEYTGALFLPHTDLDLFPSVKEFLFSRKKIQSI